jgi:hypothetical protein
MSWSNGLVGAGEAFGCAMAETLETTAATIKAMGYVNLDLFIDMSVCRW